MRLGAKQIHLCKALNLIEQYIFFLGYELVREDAYRSPRVHGEFGEKKSYAAKYSVHKLKLAQDYTLKKDGKWPVEQKEESEVLSLAHDFADLLGLAKRIKDDLCHFSMEHQGHR